MFLIKTQVSDTGPLVFLLLCRVGGVWNGNRYFRTRISGTVVCSSAVCCLCRNLYKIFTYRVYVCCGALILWISSRYSLVADATLNPHLSIYSLDIGCEPNSKDGDRRTIQSIKQINTHNNDTSRFFICYFKIIYHALNHSRKVIRFNSWILIYCSTWT